MSTRWSEEVSRSVPTSSKMESPPKSPSPSLVQPDPNPEFRLPPRAPPPPPSTSADGDAAASSSVRPFGAPRRPNSWRHPGGTVSETEECEFTEEAEAAAASGRGEAADGQAKGINKRVSVKTKILLNLPYYYSISL